MDDAGIVKTPDYMGDDSYFPDVGKELVSQALSLRGAFDESRYVHKFYRRGDGSLGPKNIREFFKPFVRDIYYAQVGINRTKGIIRRLSGGGT
jgi:hypothetical protein